MALEVTGKLYKKFPTEVKSEKFSIRNFVLEIADGQYSQLINFQLLSERCNLVDNYEEGEEIKVHFDLRGREWNGKFLTNLNCWRVEKADGSQSAEAPKPASQAAKNSPAAANNAFPSIADEPLLPTSDEDLPF